jgi:hypothetical protein
MNVEAENFIGTRAMRSAESAVACREKPSEPGTVEASAEPMARVATTLMTMAVVVVVVAVVATTTTTTTMMNEPRQRAVRCHTRKKTVEP